MRPPLSKLAVCYRIHALQTILEEALMVEKTMSQWLNGVKEEKYQNFLSELKMGDIVAKLQEVL